MSNPKLPNTLNAERSRGVDIQEMITLLKEQYDIAIKAHEDKYKAIIEGKDALLQEKDAHLSFLEDELKFVRQSFSSPDNFEPSQENQLFIAEIERLNGRIASLKQERDRALTKLSQLQNILNHDSQTRGFTASHTKLSVTHHDEDKIALIDRAIAAIKSYNDDASRTYEQKWYISNPAVQQLIREHGYSITSKVVQKCLRERADDLAEHHKKHKLGSRHNGKHDQQPISSFINLD